MLVGVVLPAEKVSLLSRLFRRSGRPRSARSRRGQSAPPGTSSTAETPRPHIKTFSAQFPAEDEERHPADWFNPGVSSLTSVATQTQPPTPTPSVHASVHASVHGSQWADNPVARLDYEDALLYGVPMGSVPVGSVPLGSDPYYQQQYPALRYGHALRHSRHDEQESGLAPTHLANSMVQLEKSGGTRTELA